MARGTKKYITKEDRGPVLLEEVVYDTQDGPVARLRPLEKLVAAGRNDGVQDRPAESTTDLPTGRSDQINQGIPVAEIYHDRDSLVVNDATPRARKGKVSTTRMVFHVMLRLL